MTVTKVRMRANAFFGDDEIDLAFPGNWEVVECRMSGHDRKALSDDEIRNALRNPVGTRTLAEMAQQAKNVCIVFDDIPKPTPVHRVAPFVLEELHSGGVSDEHIRFVCAAGSHRPLTVYPEFAAKLGKEIVERYPVYNHSIWENVVHVGDTSRGTPIFVNREYASCDLRIGIGGVIPHSRAGFGGGGKIVVPGVCGIETIDYHHTHMTGNMGRGDVIAGNVFRSDIEEGAGLAGLHFKVDAVLNGNREVVGLFAGDFVEAHRAGVILAKEVYATKIVTEADILIVSSYPDDSQPYRGFWCVEESLKQGGDMVLLINSLVGSNLHQLGSRFGSDYGGRHYRHRQRAIHPSLERAGRLIVVSPNLSKYERDQFGSGERVLWCRCWAEALAELAYKYRQDPRVVVYPCPALQIPA